MRPASRPSVRRLAERLGLQARRPEVGPRYPWSLAEHDFADTTVEGDWVLGTIALSRANGRFFHVLLAHTEELAEGFVPRANRILEAWRWETTGEGLGGERRPEDREPAGHR